METPPLPPVPSPTPSEPNSLPPVSSPAPAPAESNGFLSFMKSKPAVVGAAAGAVVGAAAMGTGDRIFTPPPAEPNPHAITMPAQTPTPEGAPRLTATANPEKNPFVQFFKEDRESIDVQRKVGRGLIQQAIDSRFLNALRVEDPKNRTATNPFDSAQPPSISWFPNQLGKSYGADYRVALDQQTLPEEFKKFYDSTHPFVQGPNNYNLRANYGYDDKGKINVFSVRVSELPIEISQWLESSDENYGGPVVFREGVDPKKLADAMFGELRFELTKETGENQERTGLNARGSWISSPIAFWKQSGMRADGSMVERSVDARGRFEQKIIPPSTVASVTTQK